MILQPKILHRKKNLKKKKKSLYKPMCKTDCWLFPRKHTILPTSASTDSSSHKSTF